MIGCKRCGNCCRWHIFYLRGYDNDVESVETMGGKVVEYDGEWFALMPAPCKWLVGNDCSIHDNKPKYCKGTPKSDEPWVRAMGCRYYEDLIVETDQKL